MADTDHDKELGRLLHDRLAAAFDGFSLERGTIPVNVVVASFLSGVVQAIVLCPEVSDRSALVNLSIQQLIEQSKVPLFALVGEHPSQEDMLAAAPVEGRA